MPKGLITFKTNNILPVERGIAMKPRIRNPFRRKETRRAEPVIDLTGRGDRPLSRGKSRLANPATEVLYHTLMAQYRPKAIAEAEAAVQREQPTLAGEAYLMAVSKKLRQA